jgi:hypothetical protein
MKPMSAGPQYEAAKVNPETNISLKCYATTEAENLPTGSEK